MVSSIELECVSRRVTAVHNTCTYTPSRQQKQAQVDALYEIHEYYLTADKGKKQVRS